MLQQRINKRYCDKKRMNDFLVANFGQNGFEVEVCDARCGEHLRAPVDLTPVQAKSEVYILTVPRELTEASKVGILVSHRH